MNFVDVAACDWLGTERMLVRMRFLQVIVVLAAVIAAAASASAPRAREVQRVDDIVIPLDEAWSAIVDLFSERNWTIQTIDKSSGIIATDWMTGGETYLDCGNAPLAVVHWTKLRLNVRAKAAENRTHIVVNVVGQQLRQVSDRFATVECTSLGRIEAQIHRAVRARSGQEK